MLIGTPGRVLQLLKTRDLVLDKLSQFVLEQCDRCLHELDMRRDVQQILARTPEGKQIMMFSSGIRSTLSNLQMKQLIERTPAACLPNGTNARLTIIDLS